LIECEINRTKKDFQSFWKEKNRPLILDGAIGTLLQERKIPIDEILWSSGVNLNFPKEVIRLHKDYIESGAEVITTNTFRTNPTSYNRSNMQVTNKNFVKNSVNLALEAMGEKEIIIAGSNAPAEDCYQAERTISKRELEYNHKKHIEWLWESGCDIIWNETQSHLDEIEIISNFCSQNSLPFIVSLFFDDNFNLLCNTSLQTAMDVIISYLPLAIGFNCIKPELFFRFAETHELPEKFGVYFNCGTGKITDAHTRINSPRLVECGIEPANYIELIKSVLNYKPLFVGSCCGSNPNHTRAIKEYFDNVYGS